MPPTACDPDPAAELGLRERRKRSTRTAIVDAALALFDERGYQEVTVEDISAAADVSPRTFFRYFAAKENVLAEPVADLLADIETGLTAQPERAAAWTALRGALAASVSRLLEHPDRLLLASRVVRANPGVLASSSGAMLEWELRVRDEVGRRLGCAADCQHAALLLGVAMVGFRTALERWAERGGQEPLGPMLDAMLDAVAAGPRALQREANSHARPDTAD